MIPRRGWNALSRGSGKSKLNAFLFANGLVVLLIILQSMTVTCLKRVSCSMGLYPFTLTQLQPFSTTITFSALWFIVEKVDKKEDKYGNIQSDSTPTFPKWKLAIIGALFTLSNFALLSGSRGEYLSGPLITLLQQMTVPFTIVLCIILMRRKFTILHFLGALVIIGGILFSIWPNLVDKEKEKNNHWWAAGLVVISTLFQSTAIVYMEKNLKYNKMPFLSSWAWINVFELILTFPLVIAIPPVQGISFKNIPSNVGDGYKCFFTNQNPASHETCGDAAAWFVLFIAVLVSNKLLMTYMIKKGSSALVMVSLTCALPLSNLAFTSSKLVGKCSAVNVDWYDLVGLSIVLCGLVVYRYTMFEPIFCKGRADRDDEPLLHGNEDN